MWWEWGEFNTLVHVDVFFWGGLVLMSDCL